MELHRPRIVLVTPALASANNGNWQTARRWARLLAPAYRVQLRRSDDSSAFAPAEALIALHARRSAAAIAAWRAQRPAAPLVVVLTGTDLYRDIEFDASARHSLQQADRLVVLNRLGARALPPPLQHMVRVVLQSCPARQPLAKPVRHLRALMVGHLRAEKDPLTYLAAAQALAGRGDLRFDHVGAALDPALAAAATDCAQAQPHYRWLGERPHGETRRRIQQAHVLVHASRLEGGAHVVIEALRSGTAVLASRIDGNVGLLGADHPGLFEPCDARALAALLARCRDDPTMLPALRAAGEQQAPAFEPAAEAASLHGLLRELLSPSHPIQGPDNP
jgi:putative glycosyltransferase (TIGR04348 family)